MPDPIRTDAGFLASLKTVADADIRALAKARLNYGESWCKRGGVGAFFTLARKWDRLDNFLSKPPTPAFQPWDILEACVVDKRPEGIIDDIRDLRRYLMLVEAKLVETSFGAAEVAKDVQDALPKNVADVMNNLRRHFSSPESPVEDQPTASQLHPE